MPTPITNAAFAQDLSVVLAQFNAGILSIDEVVVELTDLFNDWTMGAITPPQLGQQLSQTLGNWNNFVSGQLDWMTTPPTGGPHGDGTVDLTDYLGNVTTIDGLQKLQQAAAAGVTFLRYDIDAQGLNATQIANALTNLGLSPSTPQAYDNASAATAGIAIGQWYLNGVVPQLRTA